MHRCLVTLITAAFIACAIAMPTLASNTQIDKALLSEDFTQFDQHLDSGWRLVAFQGKYLEAVALMENYQKQNVRTLLPWQNASLAYHLGVVYSLANDRHKAIHWFRQALAPKLLGNPAYVDAHIAFEVNDINSLRLARHTVAAYKPNTTRTEDLEEIDAMIQYFGQPFEVAFGALNCIERTPPNSSMWQDFCKTMMEKYGALYRAHQKLE